MKEVEEEFQNIPLTEAVKGFYKNAQRFCRKLTTSSDEDNRWWLEKGADFGARWQRSQSEWKKAKEVLPQDGQDVLVRGTPSFPMSTNTKVICFDASKKVDFIEWCIIPE